MWKRNRVMTLHCPQTWPPSWPEAWLKSEMMLPVPLLPCSWNPHGHLPMKAPSTISPVWEGPGLRSQPDPLLLNPSHGPKGCLTWWTTPSRVSWWRWRGAESTLTGWKRSGPVKGLPWEAWLWGNASTHLRPCTMLSGRWQPSGFPLPNRRPLVGWRPHPDSMGCVLLISCPTPMPLVLGISGLWDRRKPWP